MGVRVILLGAGLLRPVWGARPVGRPHLPGAASWRVDGLDIRILRAMGPVAYGLCEGGIDSVRPARIARALGVTPETVRDRVARMEQAGVIAGYEIVPNLRHLGLEATAYLLRPPDESRRNDIRRSLEHVEGLLEVTYFLTPELCVDLAFQTPGQRDRRIRTLAEAAGDPAPVPFMGWAMPAVERQLTPLDWRIIKALRGDAKRSLVEVAEELGVGYRTVKRHYDRMAEERSFFVKPKLDPGAEAGLVPFGLLVFFAPDAPADTSKRVLKELDDHMLFGQAPLSPQFGHLSATLFADSARKVDELRQKAERQPGVARAQALVLTEVQPKMDWLDELIEATSRTAPPAS